MKPITYDPVEMHRRERFWELMRHLVAGLLWMLGTWVSIILIFWGIAR